MQASFEGQLHRSTNGTAVNMERLQGPALLRPNDLLNLGPVQLRYLEE